MTTTTSTAIDDTSSSSSSWDRLPISIQEFILSFLPISSLLRLAATSRSFRSLVRSPSFHSAYRSAGPPRQPLFLFFPITFTADTPLPPSPIPANAYDLLADRWVLLHLPSAALLSQSHGSLIISNPVRPPATLVCNVFSSRQPPFPVPTPSPDLDTFYFLTLVSDVASNFKIVMVETNDVVRTKVFDSRSNQWALGSQFPQKYYVIYNATLLGASLYCLTRGWRHLLKFDMEGLRWEIVSDVLPAARCLHVLAFDGKLFLVGALEEFNKIYGVGVWEMDWRTNGWKVYCCYSNMPGDQFSQFCIQDHSFQTADCKGLLYVIDTENLNDFAPMLVCDLPEKKWWWSGGQKWCEGVDFKQRFCNVHVVEPSIELLEF